MADEKPRDENMDFLSRAIVDAITKSPEVREAIRKLAEQDESYSRSFMVLMLKVRNLADSLGVKIAQAKEGDGGEGLFDLNFMDRPPEREMGRVDMANLVDGRRESDRETAFREFESSRFNQEEWLRKHGLIF